MIADIYTRIKSIFLRGKCQSATSSELATITLGNQTLTDVPVIHISGLKTKPQSNQDMLLLVPAGELDHAVALNLSGLNQEKTQIYYIMNEFLKFFAGASTAALTAPGSGGAALTAFNAKLQALIAQIAAENPTAVPPPTAQTPLDFLLK